MTYQWPELSSNYDIAIHAIGRITALWNSIESLYDEYLAYCVSGGFASFQFLSASLNNSQKIEIIKHNIKRTEKKYEPLAEHINTFFKNAQICGANRNFYIHAYILCEDEFLAFTKQSKNKVGEANIVKPSASDLRKIADQIDETLIYGRQVIKLTKKLLLGRDIPTEMPLKPAQPESWDTHPSRYIYRDNAPQRQSSPR